MSLDARRTRGGHEEVTVFDGEMTVDVDVDVLGEDAVW
jgi:hypothetical protein